MRSLVTSELFDALPRLGHPCVRFNFRGVEGSEGAWAEGRDEPLDIVAAVDALAVEIAPGTPVALVGWSFGGDMALSVTDERVSGWVGIAPPLRFRSTFGAASDARPKHLVLAAHDEFRPPGEIETEVANWPATTTEVIAGASHFFVGRTDRVVGATAEFLAKLST
ncbi:MAG: alpha/beta fold hydrolase [Actinomycetota bacterium]|nr:alpha/beta fold hydrolase [Actinomycetota bacterium]